MQFQYKKQFYFKQFGLANVCSLSVKTIIFQTIQFSISTQFSSIWPTGPYQVLPLRVRVDLRAMTVKGWMEPHHQIQDTRWMWVLPFCREVVGVFYSPSRVGQTLVFSGYYPHPAEKQLGWCILQPQPTWSDTCWDVLLLFRVAVGVIYSPSRVGQALVGGGGGLTPRQRSSRCILQPPLTEPHCM